MIKQSDALLKLYYVLLLCGFFCCFNYLSYGQKLLSKQQNSQLLRSGHFSEKIIDTVIKGPGQNFHSVFQKEPTIRLSKEEELKRFQYKKTFRTNGALNLAATTLNSTCQNSNGLISAQVTGGVPPYTFSIGDGNYYRNGYFFYVMAGNYVVTVTDASGLTATLPVTVDNKYPAVQLVYSQYTSTTACDAKDAGISLMGTGGTPPYTYSMNAGAPQSNNTFSNLFQGDYTFRVYDANGCSNNFHSISVAYFSPYSCNFPSGYGSTASTCTNTGSIEAKGMNNNPPYVYSLDGINYSSNNSFTGLTSGSYDVYIKDAKGNRSIFLIPIYQDCSMNVFWDVAEADCHQLNGSITLKPVSGTPPYSYSMDGINFQGNNVYTGLATGVYPIAVKDASGYVRNFTITVNEKCPVVTATATFADCGVSNGTITANGIGGKPPYNFSIDGINFQSSNIFSSLSKGNYIITLKDAAGITCTTTATVNENCIKVNVTPTSATCNQSNGSVLLGTTNGTPPYKYSLDGTYFTDFNQFFALDPRSYTAYVKDASGSIGTASFTITTTPVPQLTSSIIAASCQKNDGVATLSGSSGTAPYVFSNDGYSYQANNIFSSLNPGDFTFYVKDGAGCVNKSIFTVPLDCPIVTVLPQHEKCGAKNGSLTASGSNGTSPYVYSLDGAQFQTSNIFSSLSAGSYSVTIKDALGYTNEASVTVENKCPVISAIATNGLCGNANASIKTSASNGTQPYSFSIDGINFKNDSNFKLLANGNYLVTVKDAEGLTGSISVAVTNYPGASLAVTPSSATCINNDGSLTLNAIGGTAPLQYSIDGRSFQNNNLFANLPIGTYNAIVKDANGCATSQSSIIDYVNNLSLAAIDPRTICEGDKIELAVNSNAKTYSWSPSQGLNDLQLKNVVASPVVTTNYYVTASLGICTKSTSVNITVLPAPLALVNKDTTICYGQSVQLSASGGVAYQWSPSTWLTDASLNNPISLKPEQSISYFVNVSDANGCHSLKPSIVTVHVTPPAKVFAGNDTSVTLHEPLQLHAEDINKSGFTNYYWLPTAGLNFNNISDPLATPEVNTLYILRATTQEGCIGLDSIFIKVFSEVNIWVPNAFTPNGDGKNDKLRPIAVGIKTLLYFKLFDRWGNIIYQGTNVNEGWDGNLNGLAKPTDTYVWIAEGIDYKGNKIFRKGTATLLR